MDRGKIASLKLGPSELIFHLFHFKNKLFQLSHFFKRSDRLAENYIPFKIHVLQFYYFRAFAHTVTISYNEYNHLLCGTFSTA